MIAATAVRIKYRRADQDIKNKAIKVKIKKLSKNSGQFVWGLWQEFLEKIKLFLINYNDLHQAGSVFSRGWLLVDWDGGWVSAQNSPD